MLERHLLLVSSIQHQAQVSEWETGKREPSREQQELLRLAGANVLTKLGLAPIQRLAPFPDPLPRTQSHPPCLAGPLPYNTERMERRRTGPPQHLPLAETRRLPEELRRRGWVLSRPSIAQVRKRQARHNQLSTQHEVRESTGGGSAGGARGKSGGQKGRRRPGPRRRLRSGVGSCLHLSSGRGGFGAI